MDYVSGLRAGKGFFPLHLYIDNYILAHIANTERPNNRKWGYTGAESRRKREEGPEKKKISIFHKINSRGCES